LNVEVVQDEMAGVQTESVRRVLHGKADLRPIGLAPAVPMGVAGVPRGSRCQRPPSGAEPKDASTTGAIVVVAGLTATWTAMSFEGLSE